MRKREIPLKTFVLKDKSEAVRSFVSCAHAWVLADGTRVQEML